MKNTEKQLPVTKPVPVEMYLHTQRLIHDTLASMKLAAAIENNMLKLHERNRK